MRRFGLLACFVLAACKGDPKGKEAAPKPLVKGEEHPAGDPCTKAETKGSITWIEDDYPSALACAKQKKVPLVLDLWAPWCHTCISMQTTVFLDPSFAADNKKFVFAALDTDREQNAAPVGTFAPSAWPTFYVIGNDEAVLARFVGAATLDQFHEFLDAGLRAQTGSIAAADARLLGAERAMAKKDYQTADEELTAALAAAPDAWLRRAEVVYMLQMAKSKRGDTAGCLAISDKNMDLVGQTAIATNFWSTAIDCAKARLDDPIAKPTFMRAIEKLQKVLADKAAPLSLDDRAEAMGYLRDALDEIGKHGDAHAVAEQLRTLLDDAMSKAKTPFEKMAFIWPRAEVYAYLGRPLELVSDYEKLAAELPKEYDPRARLGWLYLKASKPTEAAKWTDEALALVYGPRKGRLLTQRADIAALAGDKATEKKYREQAVKLWESLPEGQQSPDNLAKARAALASMDAPGSAK
ncbi:MAG TPA: thioredoxin family protein [Kofleriaceae bacterium]|nr:thioredoxin family protein [Kofleriaceae bacterium]